MVDGCTPWISFQKGAHAGERGRMGHSRDSGLKQESHCWEADIGIAAIRT